jgi:hypothetical protein
MLQANGFEEYDYKEGRQFPDTEKPRYMFYTGKSVTDDANEITELLENPLEGKSKDRTESLNIFNQVKNNKGTYIQVIIYNSAAAEGVTIKNVRYIHLLHLPANMSKIFQIIGRGIRNCTHESLRTEDSNYTTTTPILYLDSTNQGRFEAHIRENRIFVPYLNMIKEASIDCRLNKAINPELNCFIDKNSHTASSIPYWKGYESIYPISV